MVLLFLTPLVKCLWIYFSDWFALYPFLWLRVSEEGRALPWPQNIGMFQRRSLDQNLNQDKSQRIICSKIAQRIVGWLHWSNENCPSSPLPSDLGKLWKVNRHTKLHLTTKKCLLWSKERSLKIKARFKDSNRYLYQLFVLVFVYVFVHFDKTRLDRN